MSRCYTGAAGRIDLAGIGRLGSGFAVQPKIDGVFAELHIGAGGRVADVLSRTGRPLDGDEARSLIGVVLGYPGTRVHAELEAHTPAGVRAAAARGYAVAWAHDAVMIGGRDMSRRPYRERRDALLSMLGDVENWIGDDRAWTPDRRGDAHGSDGRYTVATPPSWRVLREVPQYGLDHAARLYEEAVDGDAEGLVVVALDAPVGRRGAKRKCKPVDYLSGTVIRVSAKTVLLDVQGAPVVVGLCGWQLEPGDIVDVEHEGWYPGSAPRFARIHNLRRDLAGTA